MKILVIDDDENFSGPFQELLEEFGHECKTATNPERGFKMVDHSFDLVFIDFKFEDQDTNGGHLCARIKAKCPLVIRVLVTAFGGEDEVISDYINAGFHNYFAKKIDGESVQHYYARLPRCIEIAKERFENKIQTRFKQKDLVSIENRLNLIEEVLEHVDNQYSTNYIIAAGAYLLETGRPLDLQLLRNFNNAADKKAFSAEYQLGDYRKFTKFFQLKINDKNYTENTLKTRYLLLQDTGKYRKTKAYYKPVNAIKREFRIP